MSETRVAGFSDPAVAGLEVYVVGGAVRDALLGEEPGDRDWVVVGATPEDMEARGFIPVGGDFPVFLHPRTKEEYALARTERKSGRGYKGFTFYTGTDVTLEADLCRRDLTINAIAQRPDGQLVDPLDGKGDIERRQLRHVGQAFVEDPVRLLRLARFAARFPSFSVAPDTLSLAKQLVDQGEVDALVPERVWQELAKGLMTTDPGRMFAVLRDTGALPRVLPGFQYDAAVQDAELRCAHKRQLELAERFALACRLTDQPASIASHIRSPAECRDYARLLPLVLAQHSSEAPEQWLDLMQSCDALRRPQRFLRLLETSVCVEAIDLSAWQTRLETMRAVDAGSVAARHRSAPADIPVAVRQARLDALSAL